MKDTGSELIFKIGHLFSIRYRLIMTQSNIIFGVQSLGDRYSCLIKLTT